MPQEKRGDSQMKCYYHPNRDAVGTCSQCGKAACRDCIEDIGGALLCKDCITAVEETVAAEDEATTKKAKRSIVWSWVITVVVSFFLIPMIFDAKDISTIVKTGLSLFAIYFIWSTYWGWKVVWPWWKKFLGKIGCFLVANPLTWVIVIVLFFYIPFAGAYIYGIFGGGSLSILKISKDKQRKSMIKLAGNLNLKLDHNSNLKSW